MKNNKLNLQKSNRKLRSRVFNELLFIILSMLGLICLIALISYSAGENPWSGSVELGAPILNQAGIIGAYFGDIGFSILGYSTYLIPIALVWLGYKIHKNNAQPSNSVLVISIRFGAFVVLVAFVAALLEQNTETSAGGWMGQMMHGYFVAWFGATSVIIYLSIVIIAFSIVSNISWASIFGGLLVLLKLLASLFQALYRLLVTVFKYFRKPSANPNKVHTKKFLMNKKIKKAEPAAANLFTSTTKGELPDLTLLDEADANKTGYFEQEFNDMSRQVELKLADFGFAVVVNTVTPGPVVTQFELSLEAGVKVSQIMNLNKDLARALLVESVRIVDVIPGKPVIGLEIPNPQRETIRLKEILIGDDFVKSTSPLTLGLGKDINGAPVVVNLAKMPHLLVAGATGMGKSVGLNAMILSILFKATPEQVRLIMIDPKIVELACYADIPHLLTPVITDMNQAASALWWCVSEMERRYILLAKLGVRNIDGFNDKIKKAQQGKPLLDPLFNPNTAEAGETAAELTALPLIVVVIDEYADMLGTLAQADRTKAKQVESLLIRLAQKARAAGIHLIITTQRPSVDVITGLIKSNVPTRIAFKVSSKVDSRTILDQGGAEQLLGMGDMLYMTPGISHLNRVHGALVSDDEINRVVEFLRENSEPNYVGGILTVQTGDAEDEGIKSDPSGELDTLYDEAVQIVTSSRRVSISGLQRQMRIGYNRAARIVEDMESSGVVSAMNTAGNRTVLAPEPINTDD